MTSLRDVLDDPAFKALLRDIEAEAARLGYKPENGYLLTPVQKRAKLRRNRIGNRAARRAGCVRTELVPGRGPRRYRIALTPADELRMYSRINRLTWDPSTRPTPTRDTHTCSYWCKGCADA